jgi:hypothetical protein
LACSAITAVRICWLAGVCSLGMLVVRRAAGGEKAGRRGVLRLQLSLRRRAGLRGVRGAVLSLFLQQDA